MEHRKTACFVLLVATVGAASSVLKSELISKNCFNTLEDLCTSYNVSDVTVSDVTDMSFLFSFAVRVPNSISTWDVGRVTNMSYMFNAAEGFNQPLESWNVSSAKDTSYMFAGASEFNRSLNAWGNNTGHVVTMSQMFAEASSFDQPLDSWDVSNVEYMDAMFGRALSFNQPLSNWAVKNVRDFRAMFYNASRFDANISGWNVSKGNTAVMLYDTLSRKTYREDYCKSDYASKWEHAGVYCPEIHSGTYSTVGDTKEVEKGTVAIVLNPTSYDYGNTNDWILYGRVYLNPPFSFRQIILSKEGADLLLAVAADEAPLDKIQDNPLVQDGLKQILDGFCVEFFEHYDLNNERRIWKKCLESTYDELLGIREEVYNTDNKYSLVVHGRYEGSSTGSELLFLQIDSPPPPQNSPLDDDDGDGDGGNIGLVVGLVLCVVPVALASVALACVAPCVTRTRTNAKSWYNNKRIARTLHHLSA